jgi:hypothetical protein
MNAMKQSRQHRQDQSLPARVGFAALALMMTVLATPAAAQIPVGSKVGEVAPSAGAYESLGRRDPFVSLIAPRRAAQPGTARVGTGLGSFQIADVAVTGIVRIGAGETRVAILQNVDKQSYVAKVGSRLGDGVVKSIDAAGVVFVESTDPNAARPREVRKLLHTADEVKR